MNKERQIILLWILIIVCITAIIIMQWSRPKVAYVRSQDLVYAYDGMKEMQQKFIAKQEEWQSQLDTLKQIYQLTLTNYQKNESSLGKEEKLYQQKMLQSQYANINSLGTSIDKKSKSEEEIMLQGVLNQINSFTEAYGKKEGYDFILGTTLSGNILYAAETKDITEEILEKLNRQYHNGQSNE